MNRLKNLREDKDLPQKDIADIHWTQIYPSKYELSKINISNELLIKFSLFYNTSTDYILEITNNKKAYEKVKVEL